MGRVKSQRGAPPTCHPDRPYFASGLCDPCYQRRRRTGEFRLRKNESNRKFSRANRDRVREYHRRYAYGLEPADYQAMVMQQSGRCKICKEEKPLCVDHCHDTGTVRGLLCRRCNGFFGAVERCPEIVTNIAEYLQLALRIKQWNS